MYIFVLGSLLALALTILPGFKKRDWKKLILPTITSFILYVLINFEKTSEADGLGVLFALGFFIITLSFVFKDKLLAYITEGTLLLYGLVSLYVVDSIVTTSGEFGAFFLYIEKALIIYCIFTFLLCITRFRVGYLFQIFLFVCFLFSNLIILLTFMSFDTFLIFLNNSGNASNQIILLFTGYNFVYLLSNLVFILYLIPIPSKSETFASRWKKVKEHASDIELRYVDIDAGFNKTAFLVSIALILYLNSIYVFISHELMVVLILMFRGLFSGHMIRKDSVNSY